jgi:hypothetical protein
MSSLLERERGHGNDPYVKSNSYVLFSIVLSVRLSATSKKLKSSLKNYDLSKFLKRSDIYDLGNEIKFGIFTEVKIWIFFLYALHPKCVRTFCMFLIIVVTFSSIIAFISIASLPNCKLIYWTEGRVIFPPKTTFVCLRLQILYDRQHDLSAI